MMIIGIDPHKTSHTATALDPVLNMGVASVRVDAALDGYRRLLRWGRQFDERRWAVENAKGLGSHLAQWLVDQGEEVEDVATTATARVRGALSGRQPPQRRDRRCCCRQRGGAGRRLGRGDR